MPMVTTCNWQLNRCKSIESFYCCPKRNCSVKVSGGYGNLNFRRSFRVKRNRFRHRRKVQKDNCYICKIHLLNRMNSSASFACSLSQLAIENWTDAQPLSHFIAVLWKNRSMAKRYCSVNVTGGYGKWKIESFHVFSIIAFILLDVDV